MTALSDRILTLFPPDGSTGLTRRSIVKSLALGPMQTNKVYAALNALVAEGRLVSDRPGPRYAPVYWLPEPMQSRSALTTSCACDLCASGKYAPTLNEAVRRVRQTANIPVPPWAVLYHYERGRDAVSPFVGCPSCSFTIAAIRAEFAKLAEGQT